ncbi:hypothetical protein EON83_18870 [bacterium]|nr:MAG: hypothetical protein EON83_18870 [bacterium]
MRFRLFPAYSCALLALSIGCAAQAEPRGLFRQNNPALDEVSGIAIVRSQPSLFWMHNDSGDKARVFAVNKQGKIALTVNLVGANAFDWEDMSAQKDWVYMGDIGDNFGFRASVQVYRFKSPTISASAQNGVLNLKAGQWQKTTLIYPDGPHNCESLAATPDGRLLVVTKEMSGEGGFYVWNKPWKGDATITLTKIGKWTFGPADKREGLTTGADFSPDGRKLVVTTYTDLYEFPLKRSFDFSSIQFTPQTQPLPEQKQCEAVCYTLDGRSIYSTSEGNGSLMWLLPSKLK